MASDVYYIGAFVGFFLLLGILAPLLNQEFSSSLTEGYNADDAIDASDRPTSLTSWMIIANLFVIPFWTFGFPAYINLTILLIIRVMFIFVIARNIWIGGGG